MRHFYYGILFFMMAISGCYITSCAPGSCIEETESRVKATFYLGNIAQAPDSVTLFGLNMDTLKIYDATKDLKSAEFPLYAADQTRTFVIGINDLVDTIEFRYSSYTHFISKECGYTYYYNLDTVFHSFNIIDSITFTKKNITTLYEENIRIYY